MESWRNRKTLILSRSDMMGLLTAADYVTCVEQAYRMHGEGRFYMDPKGHIVLDKYPGEWEAMPSYIEEPEAAACKWVSIRERNREKYDLPTVFSILIYTHPETGFPLAICDGSYHTVMRTGAAAAVSAKWMARKDSKRLAIVGAGHMAEGTLATCNEIFAWEEVRIWSRTQATLDHFLATQQPKFRKLKIKISTKLPEVVSGADVVVTVTPARGAIVMNEWVAPGRHIAALGADKGAIRSSILRSCSERVSLSTISASAAPTERLMCLCAPASSTRATLPARSARSSPAARPDGPGTTKSPCLTPPASLCRIRRRYHLNTSVR